MVLDLTRKEVREYILRAMTDIITEANIQVVAIYYSICTVYYVNVYVQYIKWDMNRPLTEVFSYEQTPVHTASTPMYQSETAHRYVLGLYEIQYRLRQTFPALIIENCASGGG